MLKKLIAAILALASVLCVFTGCGEHEHQFEESKLISAATCELAGKMEYKCSCGETKVMSIPKAHVWSESYCGEEQVCTVDGCGQVRTNPGTHSLDYATKTCKNCSRPSIIVNLPDEATTVKIYNSAGNVVSTLLVEVEDCRISSETVTITWRAEKTAGGNNANALTATVISYKLMDKDGFIVKSGNDTAPDIAVGDKVRNLSFTLNGLDLWGTYTLEFADYTK